MAKKRPNATGKTRRAPKAVAPRLEACLACDGATGDHRGKFTLYGVFDRIFVREFPGSHGFFLYLRVEAAVGKHKISFEIQGPGLSQKNNPYPPLDIEIESVGVGQVIAFINAATFKRPGKHAIQVRLDGKPIGHPMSLAVERVKGGAAL